MILNGIKWRVFFVSSNHPMLMRPDGSWTIGSCNNKTKCIYICEGLSPAILWKVLCHEITHAAMFSYCVFLDSYTEELLADLVSTYGTEIITITDRVFFKIREKFS